MTKDLERSAIEGESPVVERLHEVSWTRVAYFEISVWKPETYTSNLKYKYETDSVEYREGKLKSRNKFQLKDLKPYGNRVTKALKIYKSES